MIIKEYMELKKILMYCSFANNSMFQLLSRSYFSSHTLKGSIYLCPMHSHWLHLVMVLWLNDQWCRDETESLLWARTQGWAARHALVSRLIVVIHYGTTPRSFLLWTFSQSDRRILSQYVAIFCPNLSLVSCQIPSHGFASIFTIGVTCFSTLKCLVRISGRDSFKGGRL
jgi:hypothetical protein